LRNVSSAYAIPGISSNAALWEYGHEETGGGSVSGGFFAAARPRLSFDTSDGSEVNSVWGVPALAAEAERASAEEEVSVKGEGGVV
jgi:hypothetical protein